VDIVIDGGAGTRDASTVIDAGNDEVKIIGQGKEILV
jgi:tRNA A37 threonylcarbamoyladenosine synthetase subunit TsaC/SUA5/YrdC